MQTTVIAVTHARVRPDAEGGQRRGRYDDTPHPIACADAVAVACIRTEALFGGDLLHPPLRQLRAERRRFDGLVEHQNVVGAR